MTAPDDLGAVVRRFWAAAAGDDRTALHRFLCADVTCVAGPGVLHGVADTLRSGALTHAIGSLLDVHTRSCAIDLGSALVVYDVPDGGRAVQSQLWRRDDTTWRLASVHASTPRRGFDSTVWRVVGDPLVASSAPGPLAGTTVAVKDVFAVAGFATGGGVPAYEQSAPIATEHATAVARLLNSGAHIRGIARTDQFAYSMAGDNQHYGTPPNAAVPAALPGGSSSGPASAVAHGDADLGLATTGVAGPDPQDGVEVGVVFIAIATPDGVMSDRLDLDGDRERIRRSATTAALRLALAHLGHGDVE